MILRVIIWEFLLFGVLQLVNARGYYFATENLVRQNFEYSWKVFMLPNVDGIESNSITSGDIRLSNEKLANASWIFELENDRHGVLLYATYNRPSPFYACNREYDVWVNPWDLILGNVSVSSGSATIWLPRMTASNICSQDRDWDDGTQCETESSSRGCRKIRKSVFTWTSLRYELDNLDGEQQLGGTFGDFLEIKFNFLFLSKRDNAELIEKYNAPFSDKTLLDLDL